MLSTDVTRVLVKSDERIAGMDEVDDEVVIRRRGGTQRHDSEVMTVR